jgi:hypothetical protein
VGRLLSERIAIGSKAEKRGAFRCRGPPVQKGRNALRFAPLFRPEWMFAPELKSGAVISVLEDWPRRLCQDNRIPRKRGGE